MADEPGLNQIPEHKRVYRCGSSKIAGCGRVVLARHITEIGGCYWCGCRCVSAASEVEDDPNRGPRYTDKDDNTISEIEWMKQEGYEFDSQQWTEQSAVVAQREAQRAVQE